MDRLTSSQISDFNNPLAFARDRSNRVGETNLDSIQSRTFRTSDREASFRLVTGAARRLETLRGNLETMLELSRSGQTSRGNTFRTQEIYGKLRSLSAGFDQVVESVRFDGVPIFTGNTISLNMGNGSRALSIEASKLFTYGEDSLNLSSSKQTAEITIFETVDDVIVNQDTDFTGISLVGASYIEGSNSALELDNDNYKVKIFFSGNNSAVEIRDKSGGIVERQEGVNLSGEGREFVNFDVGVQLEIEKDPILDALDDLDFNIATTTEISSSILYRRVDSHTLRNDGSSSGEPDGASFMFNASLSGESGRVSVSDPQLTPPANSNLALESGFYNLNIEYRGEESYARLTDSLGRIRGYKFGIDLTEERTTINFDGGLNVTVNNTGFSGNGSLQIPIEYNRTPPAIEEFDFREYTKQIEAALSVVEEELVKMEETAAEIQEINRQRNPSVQATNSSLASLNNTSSLNILSGGLNGPLAINRSEIGARLALAANDIFSTTTALRTQANQTPGELASLRQASAANLLGGAF